MVVVAYDRKLAQLRAFAAAAGRTDAKPTLNLAALDEKYAYGELSKAEYEKLKAQAVVAVGQALSRLRPTRRTRPQVLPPLRREGVNTARIQESEVRRQKTEGGSDLL